MDAASLAGEVRETHTSAVHTLSLVIAVVRARLLAAVVSREALLAHALPIHASAVVIALIRAGRDGTIGAFPAGVTEAAAGVGLVGAVATAACVHALMESRVNKGCCYRISLL